MRDKNVSSVLRSFLAALLVLVMALSMPVFALADEAVVDGAADDSSATAENAAGGSESTPSDSTGNKNESNISVVGFYREGRYVDYYEKYQDFDKAMPEIVVAADQLISATAPHEIQATYEGKDHL